MSHADPEATINLGGVSAHVEGIPTTYGGHGYPPRPGQNGASQGASSFVDGAGPLFSMYVEMTTEHDKEMANSWKGDADGILVFTGLFSAAVATLISVSVQDLRPSSQDTSDFYLANIYQLLADANGSHVPFPSTLRDPSVPFAPPTYAIWVNLFWFLSLVISLTCALLATMLQQWARRYIKITQPRYSSDKRARIRAFFSEGVAKLHLPLVVEALPALLHLSLFLFFSGLLVFLFNIHHTVFTAVACWIALCVAMYACITFMPILRRDSPYHAPLSTVVWYLVSGILFLLSHALHHFPVSSYPPWGRFGGWRDQFGAWFQQGPEKIAEEHARKPPSGIDGRLLSLTFDSLDEDVELERFFSFIPSFCGSELVTDPRGTFITPNEGKLLWALIGFMDRTLASPLIPNSVKERRTAICVKAMDAASLPLHATIFDRIFSEEWNGFLSSVELGLFLRRKVDHNEPGAASYSQCAISIMISRDQERKDRWFELASGHLGVSALDLRHYLAHGDSVLLANCIHITRYIISIYSEQGWRHSAGSKSKTLESVTKFDILFTLPELQHKFCHLWNDTVSRIQGPGPVDHNTQIICILALKHLRMAYISLHQGTNAAPTLFSANTDIDDSILDEPPSYPLCNVEDHHRAPSAHSTPGTLQVPASATEGAAAVPRAISSAPLPNVALTPDPSSTGPDAPPRSSLDDVPAEPVPNVAPSDSASPRGQRTTASTDSIQHAVLHGVVTGAAESIAGSSALSATGTPSPSAARDAPPPPPSRTVTLAGTPPPSPQSGFPTSPSPSPSPSPSSPSAPTSSLVAPPATFVSNPRTISSDCTASDERDVPHDDPDLVRTNEGASPPSSPDVARGTHRISGP